LMRTSPFFGFGMSRVSTWKSPPGPGTLTTVIVPIAVLVVAIVSDLILRRGRTH
jgi:hypothetical protein